MISAVRFTSPIPFEPSAVAALEQALEPIFMSLIEAAQAEAAAKGRDEIELKDLEVVQKRIAKKGLPAGWTA